MPPLNARLIVLASLLAQACSAQALEAQAYRLQLGDGSTYRLHSATLARTSKAVDQPSPVLSARPYAEEIAWAAAEAGLDPALVHAVIQVESAYRADAVSTKGALGLMQLMPETALRFGSPDASEPKANLRAGTRYLRALLDRFDQRTDLALAAYNAGEGAVLRHAGNIPPYPETQRYVPAVLEKFKAWRSGPTEQAEYLSGTRLVKAALEKAPPRHRSRTM